MACKHPRLVTTEVRIDHESGPGSHWTTVLQCDDCRAEWSTSKGFDYLLSRTEEDVIRTMQADIRALTRRLGALELRE